MGERSASGVTESVGKQMSTRAIILRTAGTNCDQESAHALRMAGAEPEVIHINQLIERKVNLDPYRLMIIPGGFSYGDDIAAGKILANELRFKLRDALTEFVSQDKRIIGICNGFQVLVKTGFLPGTSDQKQTVTLAANDSGRFQCHWVKLKREKSACEWLNRTEIEWDLPIAHGEGKFVAQDNATLALLEKNQQVLFRYRGTNPNGSANAIAGICSADGRVVGLMPHPERHVSRSQHPEWTRFRDPGKGKVPVGLQFFQAAVLN
jgi:phosphoribosylformylglycinamidine synthase subunit PurQ / glutaminase